MKKGFLSVLLLTLSLGLLYSCKDEPAPDNKIEDDTALDIGDFLPTKAGSWWLYNSTLPDQYLREATGIDTMKAGYNFKLYTYKPVSTGDKDPEYFGKFDGKDYYTLFTFDSLEANYFKVIILRDSTFVGDTWVNSGVMPYETSVISGEVDIKVYCEVKSLNHTIHTPDSTFNNVIMMQGRLTGTTALIPGEIDCGTITYYFVKGVGVVSQTFDIEIKVLGIKFFEKKHSETLADYHIEK